MGAYENKEAYVGLGEIMHKEHKRLNPTDPLSPSAALLVKLGSIIVHYAEMTSAKGHAFDKHALDSLLQDDEVVTWFAQMDDMAMLPVKR
jgi:hypothetical protein